jgi:hypothetical protein
MRCGHLVNAREFYRPLECALKRLIVHVVAAHYAGTRVNRMDRLRKNPKPRPRSARARKFAFQRITVVLFEDACGNLINLDQPAA